MDPHWYGSLLGICLAANLLLAWGWRCDRRDYQRRERELLADSWQQHGVAWEDERRRPKKGLKGVLLAL